MRSPQLCKVRSKVVEIFVEEREHLIENLGKLLYPYEYISTLKLFELKGRHQTNLGGFIDCMEIEMSRPIGLLGCFSAELFFRTQEISLSRVSESDKTR